MHDEACERRVVRERFERRYADGNREPWDYESRAAEILRHRWVVERVARAVSDHQFARARVLDVGCGLGQISARLATRSLDLVAMDVSVNAIRRAAARIRACATAGQDAGMVLLAGSAVEIPFANESFDIVVASDGPFSWDLSAGDRAVALAELRRILRPAGCIIFTEHTRYHRFDELVTEIRGAGFEVERREHLYDRLWYQLESWVRAVQSLSLVKAARRNVGAALILQMVGRAFGPRASRHICILARQRRQT